MHRGWRDRAAAQHLRTGGDGTLDQPGDPGRGRVTPKGQPPAAIDPALLARLMAMGFRYEEIAPLARKAEAAGVLDVERYIIKELIG